MDSGRFKSRRISISGPRRGRTGPLGCGWFCENANERGDSEGGCKVNPEGVDDAIDAGVLVELAPRLVPVALDSMLAELGVTSPIGITLVALSEAVAMLA